MCADDSRRNGEIRSYRDLRVWQEGIEIAKACYTLTRPFPKEEAYGMTSQIRRAAASVPANIAEGYGRSSRQEYVRFLHIAQGSLKELETHVFLSAEVGLAATDAAESILALSDRLGRRIRALFTSLRAS